jgi:hypothetical protein
MPQALDLAYVSTVNYVCGAIHRYCERTEAMATNRAQDHHFQDFRMDEISSIEFLKKKKKRIMRIHLRASRWEWYKNCDSSDRRWTSSSITEIPCEGIICLHQPPPSDTVCWANKSGCGLPPTVFHLIGTQATKGRCCATWAYTSVVSSLVQTLPLLVGGFTSVIPRYG